MIDLYKLHDNAEKLDHFNNKHNVSALHAWIHGTETKEWNEKILAKDARIAFKYAKNILKGRFELAEPSIAKNAKVALDYAISFNFRFEEAEPIIAKDYVLARKYDKHFGTNLV